MRSPAAHGPWMARACISLSNWSSTRSAVRRKASSRNAVGLAGGKKCSSPPSACVGDGLAHAEMINLRDYVVEALDGLDIDSGIDVDAVAHQLFDVEIAFRVAAAFGVGVCKLVAQPDLRVPGDDRIQIHFLERLAAVIDAAPRDDVEAGKQRLGFL